MSQNNPNKTSDCKTQKIFLVFNEKISTSSDDLRCKIIHEQQELDEQFINKATQDGLEFEKLYYKQHTVDDVLQNRIPTFAGWTPGKILLNNGFEFVESIDLLAKSPFKIYGSNRINHYIRTNEKGELKDSLELKREIPVLVDQFTSPTYVPNLSKMLIEVAIKQISGTIHLAGSTRISRYEFARIIANELNLDSALLKPTRIAEMKWIAQRPYDSSLDISKSIQILDNKPQTIENSLECFLSQIKTPS